VSFTREAGRVEYPLTFNQHEMWAQCQLHGESALNNVAVELALDGPLDVGALRRAFAAVIDRHEALRTAFPTRRGIPIQRVEPVRGDLAHRDLSYVPAAARRAAAAERVDALVRQPFRVDRAPLFRTELFRLDGERSILAFVFHHLILDGYCLPELLEDLVRAYRAASAGDRQLLPALALQYGDFAVWQERALAAGEFDRHEAFWRRQLRAPLPTVVLSGEHRPGSAPSFESRSMVRSLSPALSTALAELAARRGTTIFRIILAVFEVLVAGVAGTRDLLLTLPFSIRPVGMEEVVGLFANTLPLRATIEPEAGFDRLLADTTTRLREARTHREFPLVRVFRGAALARDANRPAVPLCISQVRRFAASVGDLRITSSLLPFLRASPFDLWLLVATDFACVELALQYSADLFDEARVAVLADLFESSLADVVANPATPICQLEPFAAPTRTVAAAASGGVPPREYVG